MNNNINPRILNKVRDQVRKEVSLLRATRNSDELDLTGNNWENIISKALKGERLGYNNIGDIKITNDDDDDESSYYVEAKTKLSKHPATQKNILTVFGRFPVVMGNSAAAIARRLVDQFNERIKDNTHCFFLLRNKELSRFKIVVFEITKLCFDDYEWSLTKVKNSNFHVVLYGKKSGESQHSVSWSSKGSHLSLRINFEEQKNKKELTFRVNKPRMINMEVLYRMIEC